MLTTYLPMQKVKNSFKIYDQNNMVNKSDPLDMETVSEYF